MGHPFLTHSPEPLITVLLLPFLWMTLQTSQWSQILQIKFCRKQSAYVVLSNDKYTGNFHNANCLHIIHKGTLSKPNCKRPIFILFTDCQSQHYSSWFAHIWLPLYLSFLYSFIMSARCHLSDNAIVRKKNTNSIDAFINTYVLFLCILYNSSPCTFPPCSSLQIMLQFLNKW